MRLVAPRIVTPVCGAVAMLTQPQRLARAFFWGCVGAALALIAQAAAQLFAPVAPVELLEPSIVYSSEPYSVYRLRMRWQGTVKGCDLIVFHDRLTWRLSCDPR